MTGCRLQRGFFARDALSLARSLLGMVLVHDAPEGSTAGRIVEVEAYRGPDDRAAHSFGGRRTRRNEVMYGPAGYAYVYFIYGMHYCANVVAAGVGQPEAVLIRALEPLSGLSLMQRRRGAGRNVAEGRLAQGPANLCRAMGIGRNHNGADLVGGALRIERGTPVPEERIARAPRVGIDYAGADALLPWRFYDCGHPAVPAPGRGPR